MTTTRVTTREYVHPWQFALAVCAVIVPLPPVVLEEGGFFVLPLVAATTALLAVPLLLHARPDIFPGVAAVLAALLLPWSVFASWVGMFLFFPSVPLLVLAAAADPRRRPRAARLMAAAGLVLTVSVMTSWWSPGYYG
ncbi:hypothetical protein [Streptomyces sp. NE5-10]|uniref:hypothetical protein n=1 Tax=Streptomyces sp. NE5-10 TaxID=2759674 RepID=UPI001906FC4E|nr:hypothetical protein [Streptomyces sp. NE5-10]